MARMKSNGERGSPCRKPRRCKIGSPSMPLRSTLELDVDRMMEIQLHQRELNPRARKASRRYGQETVSNAFSTSSLRRMAGVLRQWKCLTRF
jgi:hypothetical protein